MSLSPSSTLVGALFRNGTDRSIPNGSALLGNFNIVGLKRPATAAAWECVSPDGRTKFFTFQIVLGRDPKYFGALYPTERHNADDPDYSVVLHLSRETAQPVLQVSVPLAPARPASIYAVCHPRCGP